MTWEMQVPFPAAGPMRVFDLAQQMYTGIPHHPAHPPYSFVLTKRHGDVVYPGGVSGSAAMITTGDHVGTHVDGFAHVAKLGKIYNGVEITDHQSFSAGMAVQSVHEMAPIAASGHVVDMPTLLGRELTPADGVTGDHLATWFADHGPEPAAGSVVLVRTGWDRYWDDPPRFLGTDGAAPGVALDGARWLSERGVRASGCDTVAYEHLPSPSLDVHVHLLVESGISIMEAMNLEPVVAVSEWSFFFLAAPLRIKGGTGSPIRPLAFVPQEPQP
ncbi:cyclase family protein [Pseudonocardia sp. DLS-67]